VPTIFPLLEDLHLAKNNLTSFAPLALCNIKQLHLQENPINDLTRLYGLKAIPSLTYLSLFQCGFESFVLPPEAGFNNLETLFINDNHFTTWDSVNELARLPSLTKLVLKGHMPGSRGLSVREMVIAKIPKLIDLDRCDISPVERRSAEILFLNRFGQEPIEEVHRSDIARLSALHGPPENVKKPGVKFLNVLLEHKGRQQQRSLSLDLSIRSIVGLASRLFGFAPDEVVVELRRTDFPVESIKWNRTNLLKQFDLSDNDVIAFVDLSMYTRF
jgi:hypothetical protein